MSFWIFMLIMDLLIPATMIIFGRYFSKGAPEKINPVFGYRTSRSMRNKDTWEFANRMLGRMWYNIGIIMLIITLIAMFVVFNRSVKQVSIIGGIISGFQCIFLVLPIVPIERALKKNFDKNGKKIK